jgi:hypothetical protein
MTDYVDTKTINDFTESCRMRKAAQIAEQEERRRAFLLEREGPDYDKTYDFGECFKFTHEERPVKVKDQKKDEPKSDPVIAWSVIMTLLVASALIYIFATLGV